MGFKIQGDTGDIAEVLNGQVQVNLPPTVNSAGYAAVVFENDTGSVTGVPFRMSPHVSQDNRLGVGLDTLLLSDNFNATAQNTGVWRYTFSTMTTTMGSGSILMNASNTLTGTTGTQLTSWRQFNLMGAGGLRYEVLVSFTKNALANQVVEFGFFPHGTSTAAPTEGVFFRYTSAGLVGVASYNGAEGTPVTLNAVFTPNQTYSMMICLDQRRIQFLRDNILLGSLEIPAAQGFPMMQASLPVSQLFRNSGLVSGSPVMQFKVCSVNVVLRDIHTSKPWAHQQAMQGLAYQGQNGGTMGSLALMTNSLAPGAGAAMTNTTAALGTGLGGQFTALPTLTANSDGVLCSYANPAGGANQTPRTLIITGVRLQGVVTAALTGGPLIYLYSLAFGHTNVSLATTETSSFVTATAKAPRRIPLGIETYVATAAVGVLGQGVMVTFDSPVVVNPGEFVAVCAKNVGTVTSAGTVTWLVTFDYYME